MSRFTRRVYECRNKPVLNPTSDVITRNRLPLRMRELPLAIMSDPIGSRSAIGPSEISRLHRSVTSVSCD
jgi:hypothetical protein